MFQKERERLGYLFDKNLAEAAIRLSLPSILAMMEEGVANKPCLHIVILNPAARYNRHSGVKSVVMADCSVNQELWPADRDYQKISLAKAGLSWRTGYSSREVQQRYPHLMEPGDVVYPGSVVVDGLIVACSGVQGYLDEYFADTVARCGLALCRHRRIEMVGDNGVAPDAYLNGSPPAFLSSP